MDIGGCPDGQKNAAQPHGLRGQAVDHANSPTCRVGAHAAPRHGYSCAMSTVARFLRSLPDSTLPLAVRGYSWLPDRMSDVHGGGVLRTRVLGRPAIFLRGPEAVDFVYDEDHVVRREALPGPVLDTLFGRGAVHTLDGESHRVRKDIFLGLLMDERGVADLQGRVVAGWREWTARHSGEEVVLFDDVAEVLAAAVSEWAGLPCSDASAAGTARDCVAMVDGFATPGPRHFRARRARREQEASLLPVVEHARTGRPGLADGSAVAVLARHRDAAGLPLAPHTVAVEILNVVRPTVAIAWFVAFAAHALHRWPDQRIALLTDEDGSRARAFAHEVRRFYPFAPFVGGLARRDAAWRGQRIKAGTMVLLDIFGHHRDPAQWDHPRRFDPDRFLREPGAVHRLIPQGGGDPATGHRCPGEDITVTVLAALSTELASLGHTVPHQDLRIPLSRVPTLPRSGMRIRLP
ncbi:cytochrome P450 [Streptomyces zhihengii]|uniref:cytochrome P450 n=1 Tax=Streptomyces zhihengii TaxID=1818004 RepID=UPI00363F5724